MDLTATPMFDNAKALMEDYLKAFGIDRFPAIVPMPGSGVSLESDGRAYAIVIGTETDVEKVPVADWVIVTGNLLLHSAGSDVTPLLLGPEFEKNEQSRRTAEDLQYIIDLSAIYQCYLQNPVETYCVYDDAVALKDEASLHPLAVALGLSHPRGLASMGFDPDEHRPLFEETAFFKHVITNKRPDLALLVALQNVWQKQHNSSISLKLDNGVVRILPA